MTKTELKEIMKIANDDNVILLGEDIAIFEGCAFKEFEPVYCTRYQVARLFRYQARLMNGTWDMVELNDCIEIAKRKFKLID